MVVSFISVKRQNFCVSERRAIGGVVCSQASVNGNLITRVVRTEAQTPTNHRVTDMDFFAEDVDLLAGASIDGRVFVWKITEGKDEDDKQQIIGDIVIALQIEVESEFCEANRVNGQPQLLDLESMAFHS
ncbi:hypothetical protein Tco_0864712 [Tanacetum coccineum]